LERHNQLGASLKLRDAQFTLAPFIPSMMGIDIAKLLDDIKQRLELIDSDLCSVQGAVGSLSAIQIRYLEII